jgi:L-asparaginase/beta-aspartyl-peptidase (threonine type)
MSAHSDKATLVVHGGAGVTAGHDYREPAEFMRRLLQDGGEQLRDARSALPLVVQMVAAMEASGLFVAGKGSAPNQSGEVEMDASVMRGDDGQAGAVAAVRGVVSPVRLALTVLRESPHLMLAGRGAEDFADAEGLARVADPASYYRPATDITRVGDAPDADVPLAHGTVGAVAVDRDGRLAAATSTGGTINKQPGRVGDTPLIGAATWADARVAVSCTGQGEYFIRVAAAHDVAARVRYARASLGSAAAAVVAAVGALGGNGGLIAVDREGQVAMPFNSEGMKRGVVRMGGAPEVAVY